MLRGGTLAVALLIGGGALLVAAWALAGRATSSDIITALEPGWTGGIVFAVAQLALLPNVVLWAVAWLAGPGFAVGEGTSFTPFGTISGPLPAIPLLGALPGEDWANPITAWAPVLVVACGVAAGLFAWRRLEPSLVRWSDVGWVLGGIVLTPAVAMLLGQWMAAGAGGPGRLADVGANALMAAGLVSAEVAGGAAAVLLGAKLDAVGLLGRVRDRGDDAGRGPESSVVDLLHDEGSGGADAPERSDGPGEPDASELDRPELDRPEPGGSDDSVEPDRPEPSGRPAEGAGDASTDGWARGPVST